MRAKAATRRAKPARPDARRDRTGSRCVLRLFVAGATARSKQAVLSIHRLCEVDLKGNCDLEVIDIYQQPALARANQIVATPTLVQELPQPVRRFIGNFTDIGSLFVDLALVARQKIAP